MFGAPRPRVRWVVIPLALLAWATTAFSGSQYYRKGTFAIGGGFNTPVGAANPYFDSDGTIYFSGGRNLSERGAILVEYTHNWLQISQDVLNRYSTDSTSFDNAHASLWSVMINGVLRRHPENEIVPWITGGGGYYKRNLVLTQNTAVYYPPIWDPWWGWVDGGWVPGESVTGQRSSSGFGFNVGGGIDMTIENGASFFLEARYHQTKLNGVTTQIVPVMAGIRW